MTRLPRRPTRIQSRRAASSLFLVIFAFLALICFCPVTVPVNAQVEQQPNNRYGPVIGIGLWYLLWSCVMNDPHIQVVFLDLGTTYVPLPTFVQFSTCWHIVSPQIFVRRVRVSTTLLLYRTTYNGMAVYDVTVKLRSFRTTKDIV